MVRGWWCGASFAVPQWWCRASFAVWAWWCRAFVALRGWCAGPSSPLVAVVLGSRRSSVVVWGPRSPLVVLCARRRSWGVLLGARRFSWVEVLGARWWWWTLVVFRAPWCVALVAVLVVVSSFEDEGVGSSFVFAGARRRSTVGALRCGRSLPFVPFSRWWMVVVSFMTLVLGRWGSLDVVCPC